MTQRNYNNVTTLGTLTGPVASSATTLTTTGFTSYPAVPFTITLDRNTATEEICLVTGAAGSTLTVTRGYDGTAGQAHAAGATVEHTTAALDFTEANLHVNATTGIHGASGSLVGAQGSQSIYDKTFISPVLQADVTAGDAAVTYVPSAASVRNQWRAIGPSGTDVVICTGTGALTVASLTTNGALHAIGNTALDGTVTATGLITANGSITVPSGKKVTITDAPATGTDGVNKNYADALGTALATASTIVRRDASGNTAVNKITAAVAASASTELVRKQEMDAADTALSTRVTALENGTSGTLTLNSIYQASATLGGTPKWRRIGADMFLQGGITSNTGWTTQNVAQWYQITTLSAGTFPGTDQVFQVAYATGSAYAIGWVAVRTTGAVEVLYTSTPASNFTLGLGGVNWRIGL